jgi:cytochrome c5
MLIIETGGWRMLQRNPWIAVLSVWALAACAPDAEEPAAVSPDAAEAQREIQPAWRADRLALGQATYAAACASCHDTGQEGAPVTGDRGQWEDRSDMWQAVLFNHAKSGYLDMPGKGGQPELTDESVEAATEYMLGLTFPERPRD